MNPYRDIVVVLQWSGQATFGTDYTVSATGGTLSANGLQLTMLAGVMTAFVTVTPNDDATVESAETVTAHAPQRHRLHGRHAERGDRHDRRQRHAAGV